MGGSIRRGRAVPTEIAQSLFSNGTSGTPDARSGQIVVARFGDEVTLKRFAQIDERHVELRPESRNPAHRVMKLDLAKHILNIDGIAVGAPHHDASRFPRGRSSA